MNGYIQLNIGGKLRGFKWGKWATEKYVMLLNKKPHEKLEMNMGTEDFIFIVYAGLCMNCFCKQLDPDFSFEDVVDWMEVLDSEELLKINQAIESSNFWQQTNKKKVEREQLPLSDGTNKPEKKESLPLDS